jgi:hypothetical protein
MLGGVLLGARSLEYCITHVRLRSSKRKYLVPDVGMM